MKGGGMKTYCILISTFVFFAAVNAALPVFAQELSDELIGTLELYQRNAAGIRTSVETFGNIQFKIDGDKLRFELNAVQLQPHTHYALVFYPDASRRSELIILCSAVTNRRGKVAMDGMVTLNESLLVEKTMAEFFYYFKPWVVTYSDIDSRTSRLLSWRPENYLFAERKVTKRSPELPQFLFLDAMAPVVLPAVNTLASQTGAAENYCQMLCDQKLSCCSAYCAQKQAIALLNETTCRASCNITCQNDIGSCATCYDDCANTFSVDSCYANCDTNHTDCSEDCPDIVSDLP